LTLIGANLADGSKPVHHPRFAAVRYARLMNPRTCFTVCDEEPASATSASKFSRSDVRTGLTSGESSGVRQRDVECPPNGLRERESFALGARPQAPRVRCGEPQRPHPDLVLPRLDGTKALALALLD
jgi:hypothetical protein